MRSVFGPQLTVPAPSNYSTAAGYLIIHATEDSQEANLLKSILSNLTILKHPVSSKLPTAQNKSWCSAISDMTYVKVHPFSSFCAFLNRIARELIARSRVVHSRVEFRLAY